MLEHTRRPGAVPRSGPFVVEKGSNTREIFSGEIPTPLSATPLARRPRLLRIISIAQMIQTLICRVAASASEG